MAIKLLLPVIILALSRVAFTQAIAVREGEATFHRNLLESGFSGDVLIKSEDETGFTEWLNIHHPEWQATTYGNGLYGLNRMTHRSLKSLLEFNGKIFVEPVGRKANTEALPGEFDHTLNLIPTTHVAFPEVNGSNGKLSIKEKPFDVNDIDIRGRIDISGPFDEPYTNHATYMATIAAGAGNSSTFTRGSAWASTVTTADFDRLLPDQDNDLIAKGISVQNHSYGVGLENYYGIEAAEYDRQVNALPTLLHVFSAGNKGNQTPAIGTYKGLTGYANLTGQFKVSKNTLCVGSADGNGEPVALGSRGPAHDGRIKPELIAIGDAGSSEAAAVVSGIALLVQDAWKKKYGSLPPAAMVKAILVNTAIDSDVPEVDYLTGFGYANALHAVQTVEEGTHGSEIVGQDQTIALPFQINSGAEEVRITVSWTDPPALPFAEQALVNDLDVVVARLSDGQIIHPWVLDSSPAAIQRKDPATRGVDRLNNIERITLQNPEPGAYEIRVSGSRVTGGTQEFHFATKINSGLQWTWPVVGSTARSGKVRQLRWLCPNPSAIGNVAYRFVANGQWKTIETDAVLSKNGLSWTLPDTTASLRFRITIGANQYESPDLHLMREQRLKTGFSCSDSIMLFWNKVATAESYILERLGEKYLEPYASAQDTFLILARTATLPEVFSVRPVIGAMAVSESNAVNILRQGTGCYITAFYADGYLFPGPPEFVLNIGTTYGLKSVQLERKTADGWKMVSETVNFNSISLRLSDPLPKEGFAYYRAVLIRSENRAVATEEVEVIIASKNEPYLFPNPVALDGEVSIVTDSEEDVVIRVYDQFGRIIRGSVETGPVKILKAEGLTQGLYVVRIYDSTGRNFVQRLVIK